MISNLFHGNKNEGKIESVFKFKSVDHRWGGGRGNGGRGVSSMICDTIAIE